MLQKYIIMIRQDIKEAMARRCGLDELNNMLMLTGFLFVLVALFTKKWVFTILAFVFVCICYIRVFSKNIAKRQQENVFYMKYMGNVVRYIDYIVLRIKMLIKSAGDKEYCYFVCKECKQIIRVPKGKNKVSIRCPKCSHTFIKRT